MADFLRSEQNRGPPFQYYQRPLLRLTIYDFIELVIDFIRFLFCFQYAQRLELKQRCLTDYDHRPCLPDIYMWRMGIFMLVVHSGAPSPFISVSSSVLQFSSMSSISDYVLLVLAPSSCLVFFIRKCRNLLEGWLMQNLPFKTIFYLLYMMIFYLFIF